MFNRTNLTAVNSFSSDYLDELTEKSNNSKVTSGIEECKKLVKELKYRSDYLKVLERNLIVKEKNMLDFSKSVEIYIESKVENKTKNLLSESGAKYAELNKKYITLNKSFERLQESFSTLVAENKRLKSSNSAYQANDISMKKEIGRLKSRISNQSNISRSTGGIIHSNSSTQTELGCSDDRQINKSHKVLDSSSHVARCQISILYEIWMRVYQSGLTSSLSITSWQSDQSIIDLCFLIIPMAADSLKSIFSTFKPADNGSNVKSWTNIVQYLHMFHWSFIYLDIRRVALRRTLMNSLARLSQELVTISRLVTDPTSSGYGPLRTNSDILAVLLLVALRTTNQVNDLSVILNHIIDLISIDRHVLTTFLSNFLFVPLLCRWSSVLDCCGAVSQKIIHLLKISMEETADVSLYKGHTILHGNGFDQLVLLCSKIPIFSTESDSTRNHHILVVMLDLLYVSKSPDKEFVIDLIGKLISNKSIRRTIQELGLIGTVSSLISKYNDSSDSSTNRCCLDKLKAILNQLNFDSRDL